MVVSCDCERPSDFFFSEFVRQNFVCLSLLNLLYGDDSDHCFSHFGKGNNEGFPKKKYCRGTQNNKHRAPHLVQKKLKHLNSTIRDCMGYFFQSSERDCVFSPQQFRSLSFPFGDVPTHDLTKPQTMSELKTVALIVLPNLTNMPGTNYRSSCTLTTPGGPITALINDST